MSSNTQTDDSAQSEINLTDVTNIGDSRAESLPAESVDELAGMTSEAVEAALDHATTEQAVEAVQEARLLVGANKHDPSGADDEDVAEAVENADAQPESFGDNVEDFVEAGGSIDDIDPEECESIALLAGDGAFDHDGRHGGLTPHEIGELFQERLDEFGFTNVETIVATGSGMGRKGVNEYASYLQREDDKELPELVQVSVHNTDADLDWSDRYQLRNDQILEMVDGVAIVAENGADDFVGMWVNMANEADETIVRTPNTDDDDDEDDDVPEFRDYDGDE